MRKQHHIIVLGFITLLLIVSCNKGDQDAVDTEKPVIVLNRPQEGDIFKPGSEIHFDADFSDNVALGSYKIDIHSASDGHIHGRATVNETTEWRYVRTFELESGLKNTHVHEHISIPVQVQGIPIKQGHYHFGVYLIDHAGNQQQVFVEIEIDENGETHVH